MKYVEKLYHHRGILDPFGYKDQVHLRCYLPSPQLAPFVELFFVARWDRPGQPPFTATDILTRPVVNMFFTADGAYVNGVTDGVRSYEIDDNGIYIGVKFLPGCFKAFYGDSMSMLAPQGLPATAIFPAADSAFTQKILAQPDDQRIIAQLEQLLLAYKPQFDLRFLQVQRAMELIESNETLTVTALAKELQLSPRALQRLFHDYVGVGPKWALKRSRLLKMLEYAIQDSKPNWTQIAAELNYSTQSHFTNEFRHLLGISPRTYERKVLKIPAIR